MAVSHSNSFDTGHHTVQTGPSFAWLCNVLLAQPQHSSLRSLTACARFHLCGPLPTLFLCHRRLITCCWALPWTSYKYVIDCFQLLCLCILLLESTSQCCWAINSFTVSSFICTLSELLTTPLQGSNYISTLAVFTPLEDTVCITYGHSVDGYTQYIVTSGTS